MDVIIAVLWTIFIITSYYIIFNVIMAFRAAKYSRIINKALYNNPFIQKKTKRKIKSLLTCAGISWEYNHRMKLSNGSYKTVAIDLIETMNNSLESKYGIFTDELVASLFLDAIDVFLKRSFTICTLKFYKKFLFMSI